MGKYRSAACAACLLLLVPLLVRGARVLPADSRPLVAEKYAGWSGVLRLWVEEDCPVDSGGLMAWLNGRIARFEKRHPGVYVQPQAVDAGALSDFMDSGIRPPDLILFSPGTLDGPEGLMALDVPAALRTELAHCGSWNGDIRAVPVAMGGYLWAWNAAKLDGIPNTWRDSDARLAVLPPDGARHFGAALLALCSGRYSEETNAEREVELPGVDLGLGGQATPAPTPVPTGTLACELPEGFRFDEAAFRRFTGGEADATVVTPREVRRLEALSEKGRGPDWRLSPGSAAFTDQLLCLGIVEKADGQAELCRAFLDCLLEDEAQTALSAAVAFPVTDAPSGYGAGDALAILDAALRLPGLVAVNALDKTWPKSADGIVRKFLSGDGESPDLWRALAGLLTENPNINSGIAAKRPEIAPTNAPI